MAPKPLLGNFTQFYRVKRPKPELKSLKPIAWPLDFGVLKDKGIAAPAVVAAPHNRYGTNRNAARSFAFRALWKLMLLNICLPVAFVAVVLWCEVRETARKRRVARLARLISGGLPPIVGADRSATLEWPRTGAKAKVAS